MLMTERMSHNELTKAAILSVFSWNLYDHVIIDPGVIIFIQAMMISYQAQWFTFLPNIAVIDKILYI